MKTQVHCDVGCNKHFIIGEIKTAKLAGAVEETYFNCPHCNQKYTVNYTDKRVRELQERMRKLSNKFNKPGADIEKLKKQADRLKQQIKSGMYKLSKRFQTQ